MKVIAGTARPDRDPPPAIVVPLMEDLPPAPDWLPNVQAKLEWDRLTRILHANKLLTEASLGGLAQICALHGKIVQMYAAGALPTASMVGTLRNLLNDYGLTPVAQGKVRPAEGSGKENRFARNGRRDG